MSFDGMIFAAGLGTRLRPLTDRLPKALVPVGGVPMLGRTARALIEAGADRLIINVHHHADQIERYVEAEAGFGVETHLSREVGAPLETGGGLRAARALFRGDRPLILHNADVLLGAPLAPLLARHAAEGALVSLLVMQRPTQRYLLFDEQGLLGRLDERSATRIEARPAAGAVTAWPFCGVHVASPALLTRIEERGRFSITETYLRLAREGAVIRPLPLEGVFWADVGTHATLARAEDWVAGLSESTPEAPPS